MLALLLLGCPYIGDDAAFDRMDVDGDGIAFPDDCDEGDAAVHPGADETCDGKDDDCDGDVDEADATGAPDWYADADGDGHGDASEAVVGCAAPDGYVAAADDCDDADPGVHPGASEICNDRVDEDCDGGANDCPIGDTVVGEADVSGSGAATGEAYGYALAAGDFGGDGVIDLAIAAPYGSSQYAGLVRVVTGPLATLDLDASRASAALYGETAYSDCGSALAAGDFDGDGRDDLLIGEPGGGAYGNGVVDLVPGASIAGAAYADDWTFVSAGSADAIGSVLASLGDVGGDGADDFVSGDSWGGYPEVDLFLGGSGGPTITAGYYGMASVGALGAGDIDGDGVPDVLIGDQAWSGGASDEGAVYVADATLTGYVPVTPAWTGGDTYAYLGADVASGDLDGDGRDDVVAGAPFSGDDAEPTGAVYVFSGIPTATGTAADAFATLLPTATQTAWGLRVTVPGDLDGDGADDLVLAAPYTRDDSSVMAGAAFVVYGPLSGTTIDPGVRILGEPGDYAGVDLASPGDVDGDTYPDLVVGSPQLGGGAGAVHLFLGRGL